MSDARNETTYLLINLEAFPPGWTNSQRHRGHEANLTDIGNQSTIYPHLKTHSRVNAPTKFDEDNAIIEDGVTVEQYILAGQVTLADHDAIIHSIAEGIWGNASEGNLTAVANKIELTEMTAVELQVMIVANRIYWGEIER